MGYLGLTARCPPAGNDPGFLRTRGTSMSESTMSERDWRFNQVDGAPSDLEPEPFTPLGSTAAPFPPDEAFDSLVEACRSLGPGSGRTIHGIFRGFQRRRDRSRTGQVPGGMQRPRAD